jgi:hypothetical protein
MSKEETGGREGGRNGEEDFYSHRIT